MDGLPKSFKAPPGRLTQPKHRSASLLGLPLELRLMIYDYLFPGEINLLYTKSIHQHYKNEVIDNHQLGICPEFTALRRACPELLHEILNVVLRTRIARFELSSHLSSDTIKAAIKWLQYYHTYLPSAEKEPWYGVAVCFGNKSFKPSTDYPIEHLRAQQTWSDFCRLLPPYQHFYLAFTNLRGAMKLVANPRRGMVKETSELSVSMAWINAVLQSSNILKKFVVSYRESTLDDYQPGIINGPQMLLAHPIPGKSAPGNMFERQELLFKLNESIHEYLGTRLPIDANGQVINLRKRPAWHEHAAVDTEMGAVLFESWVMKLERYGLKLKTKKAPKLRTFADLLRSPHNPLTPSSCSRERSHPSSSKRKLLTLTLKGRCDAMGRNS